MEYTKINKIEKVETESIYHLTVEKNHNFLANDILVHNCDYKGEIGIILINTGSKDFIIEQGDKIAQAVLKQVEQVEWLVVNSVEELGDSERGEGGYGSTGKK